MLLSILGNILGKDGDDGQTSAESTDGELSGSMSDDGLMPGSGSDDGMGNDDDLFGGGDGDPFDDSGSGLDEEMSIDGMEADTGGVSSELESRVEEMENEIGSLSSTVNTVQSENENIGDSLEEIEENIRKLLEVYEMVTQGVNPFVEDDSLSDSFDGAQGTGDFGGESLFDAGGEDDVDDTVDDDIANAEAEEFLDESMLDDDAEFDDGPMDDAPFDDGDDDAFADESLDDGFDSDAESGDEDLSFDELKSEYESGDAEWDEGEPTADGDLDGDASDDPFADEGTLAEEAPLDDGSAAGSTSLGGGSTLAEGAALDDGADFDDIERDAIGGELEDGLEAGVETLWADDDRPYLESVPAAYESELLAIDWLEFLVDELGLNGAARTIRFYRSIDWVSPSVESYLQTLLNGFDGGPSIDDPDPRSPLGVDHKRSLWWLNLIGAPEENPGSYEEWIEAETLSALRDEPDTDDADDPSTERVSYAESDVDGRWADPEPAGAGGDDGLDERNAQEILIDESDGAGSGRRGRRPMAEGGVDADDGRMIWVDSDVVLPESGIEVRIAQDGYDREEPGYDRADPEYDREEPGYGRRDPEYVHAASESERVGDSADLDRWEDEPVKPLVVPDDETDLERWQIEFIKSLFARDTDGMRSR